MTAYIHPHGLVRGQVYCISWFCGPGDGGLGNYRVADQRVPDGRYELHQVRKAPGGRVRTVGDAIYIFPREIMEVRVPDWLGELPDELRDPFPPFAKGSKTSEEAAGSVADDTATLRKKVLEYVRRAAQEGATCDEAERDLGLSHQTCSPRFWELRHRARIVDSGRVRKTRSGRNAVVWVALAEGSEVTP